MGTSEVNKRLYQKVAVFFRHDSKLNANFVAEYAKSRGESLNGFIVRTFEETIKRDKQKK